MSSIFSRIIAGDIPSYKIAENKDYFAFLDVNPLTRGHTLVIPKKEVDKLFDLDDKTYQGLFAFCKVIAGGIKRSFACDRVALSVIGIEVPHAHVHLIPINNMGDIDFTRPRLNLSQDEMNKIAKLIGERIVA